MSHLGLDVKSKSTKISLPPFFNDCLIRSKFLPSYCLLDFGTRDLLSMRSIFFNFQANFLFQFADYQTGATGQSHLKFHHFSGSCMNQHNVMSTVLPPYSIPYTWNIWLILGWQESNGYVDFVAENSCGNSVSFISFPVNCSDFLSKPLRVRRWQLWDGHETRIPEESFPVVQKLRPIDFLGFDIQISFVAT